MLSETDNDSTATSSTEPSQQTPTEQLFADLRHLVEELIADLDEIKATVDRIASNLGAYN